ncbi:MAG: hypothetical protein E7473_09360 [Ruminococcaceae bacterium]|nr:hypothetical protein [Oscillospiraceae bacterium]
MWIKKLYANFGNLNNKTLDLAPGLNIVSGKNESGKSTWSAFIRTMFFGISTKEKAKQGFIPDKEKYLPWNGSSMYGKMELCRGDDEIIIERTPSRSGAVLTKEEATTSKGEPAPTGEALLGIAKGVYERTAFIGQSGITIDGDKDTEKRILSIASSGDETISAGEVATRLEKRRRTLRAPRGGGIIPDLQAEISALSDAIEVSRVTENEISGAEESLEVTSKRIKEVSRALLIAKAESHRARHGVIDEAKRNVLDKEEKIKQVSNLPTREIYDNFIGKKSELESLLLDSEKSSFSLREAEAKQISLKEAAAEFPAFGGMGVDLAEKTAEEDIARLENLPSCKSGLVILCLVLALASGVLALLVSPLIAIASVLFLGFSAAFFFLSKKKCDNEKSNLARKYGIISCTPSHIRNSLSEYMSLLSELEASQRKSEVLREKTASAKAAADIRVRDINELLSPFKLSADNLPASQEKMKLDMLLRERANADLLSAKIRLEALLQGAETDSASLPEYSPEEIPEESEEELSDLLENLELRRKNLEITLASLRERLRGFNRADAEKKVSDLSLEEEKQTFLYDALSLAMDTLDASDRELKSRFSPEVEKRASEIFKALTGGSFEVVRVLGSDFDMNVSENAASVPRDKLYLSRGTYDELYLALRLALCDTILPEDESPPMVLDDALVNFDDERTERTLRYLKELSKKRQIILFTCHTREAKFFEDDAEVNKISL